MLEYVLKRAMEKSGQPVATGGARSIGWTALRRACMQSGGRGLIKSKEQLMEVAQALEESGSLVVQAPRPGERGRTWVIRSKTGV